MGLININESVKFKKDYLAYFSFAAFFLIVIGEIVLAITIPLYLSRSTAMSHEVRRIKLMRSFDKVRDAARKIKPVGNNAELERRIVMWELDKLASYLRNNVEYLDSDEVAELQKIVDQSGAILSRLRRKRSFSKAAKLDTAVFVDTVLNSKVKKTIKPEGK